MERSRVDHWNWMNDTSPWWYALGGAFLGRAMYHAKQVQLGKRKPFSWAMLTDVPVFISCGFLGKGIATYMGITEKDVLLAISLFIGYLGWYGLDRLLAHLDTLRYERKDTIK